MDPVLSSAWSRRFRAAARKLTPAEQEAMRDEILAERARRERVAMQTDERRVKRVRSRLFIRRVLDAIEDVDLAEEEAPGREEEQIAACRSVLMVVGRVLPAEAREEMLDEWMDDLESALEQGRPLLPRVVSILRSFPYMVVQCRRRQPRRREG